VTSNAYTSSGPNSVGVYLGRLNTSINPLAYYSAAISGGGSAPTAVTGTATVLPYVANCMFTLGSPGVVSIGADGSTYASFAVNTSDNACPWRVQSNGSWLRVPDVFSSCCSGNGFVTAHGDPEFHQPYRMGRHHRDQSGSCKLRGPGLARLSNFPGVWRLIRGCRRPLTDNAYDTANDSMNKTFERLCFNVLANPQSFQPRPTVYDGLSSKEISARKGQGCRPLLSGIKLAIRLLDRVPWRFGATNIKITDQSQFPVGN
jgi:hypothetical protein